MIFFNFKSLLGSETFDIMQIKKWALHSILQLAEIEKNRKISIYQIFDILIYHETEERFSKNSFTEYLRIIY